MGMRYIGFEIDEPTWKIGKERLTQRPITLGNYME